MDDPALAAPEFDEHIVIGGADLAQRSGQE
jgi:hypothetical protein